ncbi:hypothetical protein [Phenylobacterium sp.]|uniref:hypothetical protein n=1 Tax=Phenylobacterium sp. TaxID=1871053 RepID=UPI00286A9953|nr:hypothetical protein [Phenylobacterium sp.]
MQGFWKRWMTGWCGVVLAFGAILALVAWPATDGPGRFVFALIGRDPATDALLGQPGMRFAVGLMGALTIGLGLMVYGSVRAEAGAVGWRSVTRAMAVWFVIDSTISIVTGFPLNAVSNTLLMAGYLAPVLGAGVLSPRQPLV